MNKYYARIGTTLERSDVVTVMASSLESAIKEIELRYLMPNEKIIRIQESEKK